MHSFLKTPLRKIVFPLAFHAGAAGLLRRFSRNKQLIVMYHGVSGKSCFRINGRHLPAEQFEKHLQYYQKNFRVISLQQQFELFREGVDPDKPSIALTFDDGFENNLTIALPLLEKYSMPATFFISAISLEQKNVLLWPEMLEIARAFTTEAVLELAGNTFIKKGKYALQHSENGISVQSFLNKLDPATRTSSMAEFATKYKVRDHLINIHEQCWKLLDAEQLKKLSASPLAEIGSHGFSHHILTSAGVKEIETELHHSKKTIENCIQKPVVSFAFPNGSYDENVRKLSLQAGYTNLLAAGNITTEELKEKDILPRIGISNYDELSANMLNLAYLLRTHGF